MKKMLAVLLLVFLFAPGLCQAEVFQIKNLWTGINRLIAKDKESGVDLWQSQIKMQKVEDNGRPVLYILEEGTGFRGAEKEYSSWKHESYFQVQGTKLLPDQIKVVYKNEKGEIIARVEKSFDHENRKVICRVNGKKKEIEYKDDLVDRETLGIYLSNYPFGQKAEFSFHLLNHDPSLQKMIVTYQGEETVKTGEDRVQCYKLQMTPDLGALKFLAAFIPKIYFWYESKPPYNFVKYEGLESGLGSPRIILESHALPQKSS